jgi:hypothetical protein
MGAVLGLLHDSVVHVVEGGGLVLVIGLVLLLLLMLRLFGLLM